MLALFGLFQFIPGAPPHDHLLIFGIIMDHLQQAQLLRFALGNGHHIDAERNLQIAVFIQILQDFFQICVLFQFDYSARAFPVGFVADV